MPSRPGAGQWLRSIGAFAAAYSSGNCCRIARHSLFIRAHRRCALRNRCATKVRFFRQIVVRKSSKKVIFVKNSVHGSRNSTDDDPRRRVGGGACAAASAALRRASCALVRGARAAACPALRGAAGRPRRGANRRGADPGVVRRPLGPQGMGRGCGGRCRRAGPRCSTSCSPPTPRAVRPMHSIAHVDSKRWGAPCSAST